MNKEDELALCMLNWHFSMVSADLYYKSKGFLLNKKTGNFEKGEVKLKLDLNKNGTFSMYRYKGDSSEREAIVSPWAGMVVEEIEPWFKEMPSLSNLDGSTPSI